MTRDSGLKRRRKPTRLEPGAYRVLLVSHALFGACWFGTAVAGLMVVTLTMSAETVVGAARAIQLIDLLLYIPLDVATLVTGLAFSIKTHWGFLKHGWVAAKYLINLSVLATAGIVLAPAMITMESLASEQGSQAWHLAEFQAARTLYIGMEVFYIAILAVAVALPIVKPRWKLPLQGKVHLLTVEAIRPETADATTISFRVPRLLGRRYSYRPGQYLTVIARPDGTEQRRAYSLSTAPGERFPAITVKRVPGGLVSNWLLDSLQVGARINVQQPQGRFGRVLDPAQPTTCYLIAAGSGIGPLASIAKAVLNGNTASQVHLLYGNRTPADVILRGELVTLAAEQERFHLTFVYSRLPAEDAWSGPRGHIDRQLISSYLSDHPASVGDAEYFVCGPDAMTEEAVAALASCGVSERHLHRESFTTSLRPATKPVTLITELDGERAEVVTDQDTPITEALEAAGFAPPTTCRAGTCSTCLARIVEGTANMRQNHVLSEDDIAQGLVLTCQARPTSDRITIEYDAA